MSKVKNDTHCYYLVGEKPNPEEGEEYTQEDDQKIRNIKSLY